MGRRGRRGERNRMVSKGPNIIINDREENASSSRVILLTEKISLNYCPVLGLGAKRQPGRFGQKLRCKMQRKITAGHNLRRSRVHSFTEEQIVMGGLGALAPGKA